MGELWMVMTAMYGRGWVDQFGGFTDAAGNIAPTVRVWAEALAHIPPQRLRAGLEECAQRGVPYPPKLPEFIKLCGPKPWEKGLVL